MTMKDYVLGARGALLSAITVVLMGISPQPVSADEIGSSACGKAIRIRGEVKHHPLSKSDVSSIANATDQKMYVEEIYGREFSALVEGLPEGEYALEIYFAETYHNAVGQRTFDVYSGDTVLAYVQLGMH